MGPWGGSFLPQLQHFTVLSLFSRLMMLTLPHFGHLRLRLNAAMRVEYIPHMLFVPALSAG